MFLGHEAMRELREYRIPESDERLLSECEVETFASSGPGGQHVNRRDTAVRLNHYPTGIVVTCQEERSQFRNKQIALHRLRNKIRQKCTRRTPRIRTKMPKRVKEQIRQEKKNISEKKKLRKNPPLEE